MHDLTVTLRMSNALACTLLLFFCSCSASGSKRADGLDFDPFDQTHSGYVEHSWKISAFLAAASNNQSDPTQLTPAVSKLSGLASKGHAPSLFKLGEFLRHPRHNDVLDPELIRLARAPMYPVSENRNRSDIATGQDLIDRAAHTGFPDARKDIEASGRPELPIDTQPVKIVAQEEEVVAAETEEVSSGLSTGEAFEEFGTKVINGVGELTIFAAKSARTQAYQARALDYSGCCSYHGGMMKDAWARARCSITGTVICNDFTASPTCLYH